MGWSSTLNGKVGWTPWKHGIIMKYGEYLGIKWDEQGAISEEMGKCSKNGGEMDMNGEKGISIAYFWQ